MWRTWQWNWADWYSGGKKVICGPSQEVTGEKLQVEDVAFFTVYEDFISLPALRENKVIILD